jgi:hypothetical protein
MELAIRICAHICGKENLYREQIGKFGTWKVLNLMAGSLLYTISNIIKVEELTFWGCGLGIRGSCSLSSQ